MVERISPQQAKEIMVNDPNVCIVDVRNEDEYELGHIQNAILIPLSELYEKAEIILKDKNQLLLVHCRSGVRSKKACQILDELGFNNIKDFGGIIDWPYSIVK